MEKVLIIEDDELIAELERDYLETNGYETDVAYDGIEGFCIEGLKDFQFRQTAKDAFEMYAETPGTADRDYIREEMLRQMRRILKEKNLGYVRFYVNFVEVILPDTRTGKKPLILHVV